MTNPLDEFTDRRVFPFMTGVYLATNAIADAYVVIDGPPRVAALARSALLAADLVLIPV